MATQMPGECGFHVLAAHPTYPLTRTARLCPPR
jgi:hypothetical protein